MKKIILFSCLLWSQLTHAQTVVWSNDFEVPAEWTLNTPTGPNPQDPNQWVISDQEGGVAVPGCGTAGNGNKTLHVSCSGGFCLGTGAIYSAGDGGLGFSDGETHKRTSFNSNIDLTTNTNLTLSFDYIGIGAPGTDFATVLYSIDGGASWLTLSVVNPAPLCGAQGQWTLFSMALPAAVNGQNDVRVAFNWDNDNDGGGTDPSFAVNNIRITTPAVGGVPVVSFNSIAPICVGSTFTPTNTYTNSPTSYAWTGSAGISFSSATIANPVISFVGAGTYTLNVVATNGTGPSTMATQSITVTAAPTATISYANPICLSTAGTVLPTITGNSTGTFSTPPGGLTYINATGGIIPQMSSAGSYVMTYTIPAAGGCPVFTTTATATLSNCTLAPVAAFTLSPTTACINATVTTTNTSTNSPTSYAWTVTPATFTVTAGTLTSATPSFTFQAAANYTITLTATNGVGTSPVVSNTIVVSNCPAPVAAFALSPTTACLNATVTTTNTSTNSPTSYAWTVTPATFTVTAGTLTSATPSFTFQTAGTYTITLTATNANGTSPVVTNTIIVNNCPAPVASYTIADATPCLGTATNLIDNSTNGPTLWAWTVTPAGPNFSSATAQNPTITFPSAGTFTVGLVATNANGSSTISTQSIVATACPSPAAAFTFSNTAPCIGSTINVTDATTNAPTSWAWSISPTVGATLNSSVIQSPTINFTAAGSYIVTLIATNANGTSTISNTIVVASCGIPAASFVLDANVCRGDCITLSDASTGSPTSWNWTIGGTIPGTSSLQNPGEVCFTLPGIYTISLTASNASGSTTLTQTITIDDIVTVDILNNDTTITIGEDLVLTTIGTGSPSAIYTWSEPVSELNASGSNVLVSPLFNTTYIVSLSTIGGCVAKDTVVVTIFVPQAIGVPSAFSPNGDNINDVLYVKGLALKSIDFKVFNRLGQLVFETKDQELGWDGKFKGEPENPGGFVYVLDYVRLDASKGTLKGSVSIIK
jgi:gliding motility-associated-like protein